MLEAAVGFLLIAQVLHLVLTHRCMEHTQSLQQLLVMVVDTQQRIIDKVCTQSHTK